MSKRVLHGINTKESAQHVEQRILAEVRRPKKKQKLFQFVSVAILAIVACFFLYSQIVPEKDRLSATAIKDELIVEVSPLTEGDVSAYTSSWSSEEELRTHYRALLFSYYVFKEAGEQVTIEYSHDPATFMNSIDSVERYATGGGWNQNNDSEDFAHVQYRFVFNMQGLTEQELKQAFLTYKLSVTWQNEQGERVKETISLGDYVQFVKE